MNVSILIGIGAGIASAALFASAWSGTVLGVLVLFFLSPMPVAIAGLGWGWASGAIAAITGAIILAATGRLASGIIYALSLGLPGAVFAYYTLLNRTVELEAPDGSRLAAVEWYPIGRIIGWAAVWAGVLASLSMLSIGGDVANIKAALLQVLEQTVFKDVALTGGRTLTAEEKSDFATVMVQFYPLAIAGIWLTIAVLNWWAAAHVTARSGRLMRPWPDLSNLVLPQQVPLAFGASLIAMLFSSGFPMLVATGFAGAFMYALMLVGLALMHRVTRGVPARPFLLGIVYSALLILPFTGLVVALIGLAEPYVRHRIPQSGPPSGKGHPPLS